MLGAGGAAATVATACVAKLAEWQAGRPEQTAIWLRGSAEETMKPAFPAIADYALDDKGTTYRKLILDKYPDLDINFVHHAGNSSGVVDGSAAILLASPSYAKAHGLKPRARVVAMANMGDSPTLMLNAPVPAWTSSGEWYH